MWIAAALANERPADAERVISPHRGLAGQSADEQKSYWPLDVRADGESRSKASGAAHRRDKTPSAQACGWAALAFAVVDRDKAAARRAWTGRFN